VYDCAANSGRFVMRNVIWDIEFIYDTLRRGGLYAIGGGFVAMIFGFVLDRMGMVAVGGIVTVLGAVDYVVTSLLGKRKSN